MIPIWDSNFLRGIHIMTPLMTGSPQVLEGRNPLELFLADVNTGLLFSRACLGQEKGEKFCHEAWKQDGWFCASPQPVTETQPGVDGVGSKIYPCCLGGISHLLSGRKCGKQDWVYPWCLPPSIFILFWCPLGTQYPVLRGPQSFIATWAISSKKPWIQNQLLFRLQYLFSHWNGESLQQCDYNQEWSWQKIWLLTALAGDDSYSKDKECHLSFPYYSLSLNLRSLGYTREMFMVNDDGDYIDWLYFQGFVF